METRRTDLPVTPAVDAGPRQPDVCKDCERPIHWEADGHFVHDEFIPRPFLNHCPAEGHWPKPASPPVPQEAAPQAEEVAAIAYQITGVLDAPVRILDYFSAIAQGEYAENPLPFSPEEVMPRGGCSQTAPVLQGDSAVGRGAPSGQGETSATAPDWVMRVAEKINERNRARGHVLKARDGSWADVMPTEEMAALIRQVGSERERELEGKLRRSYELAHIFAKKIAMLTLSEKSYDEYSSALKELAEASRLLRGGIEMTTPSERDKQLQRAMIEASAPFAQMKVDLLNRSLPKMTIIPGQVMPEIEYPPEIHAKLEEIEVRRLEAVAHVMRRLQRREDAGRD